MLKKQNTMIFINQSDRMKRISFKNITINNMSIKLYTIVFRRGYVEITKPISRSRDMPIRGLKVNRISNTISEAIAHNKDIAKVFAHRISSDNLASTIDRLK